MHSYSAASRIYIGFLAFMGLACAAFIAPRLLAVNDGNNGLAGAATAAIIFLGCLVAALGIGIVLLVQTLRNRANLPMAAKVIGLLPLPIFAAMLLLFFYLANQRQPEQQPGESPPATLTPITTPTAP